MFDQKQLEMIWEIAKKEEIRERKKTLGANEIEQKTMEYAQSKTKETNWRLIKAIAANMFINYADPKFTSWSMGYLQIVEEWKKDTKQKSNDSTAKQGK